MNRCMTFTAFALVSALLSVAAQAADSSASGVAVIPLDPAGRSYVSLLEGPPQTKSLHAGLVILAPGESVGVHTTADNEEMLVPLEGEGELRIAGQPPIRLKPGLVTYTPPHTEHDVVNTGTAPLRYIYITAKTG
jgi:mannose-6-phosphate isomerase-like protein (cupin superfamily)